MLEHHELSELGEALPSEATPRVVFDYLAGEVFERFEASAQRLLLQLACLPRVTIDIARELSGDEGAGRVLFNLAHNDYFVRELVGPDGRVFLFHPLLKEFLLQRAARDLPAATSLVARRRAARLLRDSGQVEDAVTLLIDCRDWGDVAAIVAEQADDLLAQGRHCDARCLARGPAAAVQRRRYPAAGPRRRASPFEPPGCTAQARRGVRGLRPGRGSGGQGRLLRRHHRHPARRARRLAALDRWLAEYDRCRPSLPESGTLPLPVLAARLWRDPAHSDVAQMRPMRRDIDGGGGEILRAAAALLVGEFARAEAIEKGIEAASGERRLALAVTGALRRLMQGDPAAALETAQAGLELGIAEAIHGHDVALHLLCGAAALAQDDAESTRRELAGLDDLPMRARRPCPGPRASGRTRRGGRQR
jgi:hypothetical protein